MPTPQPFALDSTSVQASNLTDRLNKYLLAYAATAGAAGVSLLALAQPANAEVVYTPANRTIVEDSRLDLNGDNIPDFAFHGPFAICGTCTYLNVIGLKFNKMMSSAHPLVSGVSVGPDDKFRGRGAEMVFWCTCSGNPATGGPWVGVQNGYMGLEFNIEGAAHFGWARFSVTDKGAITLTGYAYETVSLKPIVTGNTGSNNNAGESVAEPPSSSLGRLALGAAGLTAQ